MESNTEIKPSIELNTFVKLKGNIGTGGKAKIHIREGHIKLNGQVETRNKKKLFLGDKVSIDGKEFVVEKELLR